MGENWRQMEEIFQRALDLPGEQREAYLAEACAGNSKLRHEIDALLAAHEAAGSFIELPALAENPASFLTDATETDELATAPLPSIIGRRIGPWQIVREVGRGGMGVVFLAQRADDAFRMQVAIKLIKRGMDTDFILRRFRNERQILASLDHPNIARLLDGGTTEDGLPYFVMEYIEGQPLNRYCDNRRLSVRERLRLFQQICTAVHHAHQNSVLHRDLKPANILVTANGIPKLLDFGIAKLLNPESSQETADLTSPTMFLMTPEYASPEQVRGHKLTPSSDQYSLGVLLYELLTGRRPHRFSSRLAHEVARVVCDQTPLKPSAALDQQPQSESEMTVASISRNRGTSPEALRNELSGDLDEIVMKALRKDPQRRYDSVEQLIADVVCYLEGQPVAASTEQLPTIGMEEHGLSEMESKTRSLAVLPFKLIRLSDENKVEDQAEDEAGDSDRFLSIGLADALITRLSSLRSVAVRPTSSILKFAATETDALTAARTMNVSYVLDGHILKVGERLRITVQLMKRDDGALLWATQFDQHNTDILNLQDSIATRVAGSLVPQLTSEEQAQLAKRGTNNSQSYEAYLRGRYHWHSYTEEGLAQAIINFYEAIALDPNYALAYTGVADYFNWLGLYGLLPPKECFAAAKNAAAKAIELDAALAEGYASLGFSTWAADWNAQESERLFQRAIELNPSYSQAHEWYALLLASQSRHDEAIGELQRAQKLDPYSPTGYMIFAFCLHKARRYEEAYAQLQRALDLDPNYLLALQGVGWVLPLLGRHEEAIAACRRAVEISERSAVTLVTLGHALATAGIVDEARQIAREIEEISTRRYVPPYYLALIYTGLGEFEMAFAWLDKGIDERDLWCQWLSVEPRLDPLRQDARFAQYLERIQSLSSAQPAAAQPSGSGTAIIDNSTAVDSSPASTAGVITAAPDETAEVPTKRPRIRLALIAGSVLIAMLAALAWVKWSKRFEENPHSIAGTQKSIVVLPFTTEGASENENSLGYGLADGLTRRLGQIKQLSVHTSTSAPSSTAQTQQIGHDLNVNHILRGKLRRNDGKLLVSVELVSANDGKILWSENFDQRIEDLSTLNHSIAEQVLRALAIETTTGERQQLAKRYTESSEAYRFYLVGRYHWSKRSVAGLNEAISHFRQALAKDPDFALAYTGLADTYALMPLYLMPAPHDAYPRAKENAIKALALDQSLAEAHASLGYVKFYFDRDHAGSVAEFRRAIELNPSYATAHHWLALTFSALGRHNEALTEIKLAQQLAPSSAIITTAVGMLYYYARQYDQSLEHGRKPLETDPGFLPSLRLMRWTYEAMGNYEEAMAAYHKERSFTGISEYYDPGWEVVLAQVQALNNRTEARATLAKAVSAPRIKRYVEFLTYEIALACVSLGDNDEAISWLAKAEADKNYSLNFAQVDPRLDPIRSDPRFVELMRKVGFNK